MATGSAAVRELRELINKLSRWVNGDSSYNLSVPGGTVKSPAKLIADAEAEINSQLADFVQARETVVTKHLEVVQTTEVLTQIKDDVLEAKEELDVLAQQVSEQSSQVQTDRQAVDDSRTEVLAAKDAVLLASDIALATVGIYANTTVGLQETQGTGSADRFFMIPSSSTAGFLDLYLNDDGTAVYQRSSPSTSVLRPETSRAGYRFVIKIGKQIVFGLRYDGKISIGPVTDVTAKLSEIPVLVSAVTPLAAAITAITSTYKNYSANRSGVLWAVRTADNKLPVRVDALGDFYVKNYNITSFLSANFQGQLDQLRALVVSDSKDVSCYGDSLTASGWPALLDSLFNADGQNRIVTNHGIGGQGSAQIAARQGGLGTLITLSGNTIPASGGVAVTSITPALLTTPATNAARSITGWLNGVYGTLAKDTGDDYTFTRSTAGDAVPVYPQSVFLPDVTAHDTRLQVFWTGRNDLGSITETDFSAIIYPIELMVARLHPLSKKWLVLSILPSSTEIIGTATATKLAALNKYMKQRWPENFVDVLGALMANGDGSAGDNADIANGITPRSLRSDSVHINEAGRAIVAQAVFDRIKMKGW